MNLEEMTSEVGMIGRQAGFWDVEQRLRQLSERGDLLEKLASTVDFEIFRAELDAALGARDRSRGGRPSGAGEKAVDLTSCAI